MGEPITRFSEVRALIFDLDGTLIDSKLDLALSVNATWRNWAAVPCRTNRSSVTSGRALRLDRAGPGQGATEEECLRGLEFFIKYYSVHKLDNTVLYPGVRETLDALTGMPMAVLTNKPVEPAAAFRGAGRSRSFSFVYGGNSFERKKPDPMGVETILREFGAAPAQVMLVGDSEVDVQTARNAGTWVCGVTYGFGSHQLRRSIRRTWWSTASRNLVPQSVTAALRNRSPISKLTSLRSATTVTRAIPRGAETSPRCVFKPSSKPMRGSYPRLFSRGRCPPANRGCLLRAAARNSPWRACPVIFSSSVSV